MNEKAIRYYKLVLTSVDKVAEDYVAGIERDFKQMLGDLPPKEIEAIKKVETALKAGAADVEAKIIALLAEKFTDEEFDTLIAFAESPAGKKLNTMWNDVQGGIAMISEVWIKQALTSIETDLQGLLGVAPPPVVAETSVETSPA